MSIEIKNLKKVAQRILKAIENKEKIILYGDGDLDGATSVIILKETIKNLGGEISTVYFPDREIEGWGLSKNALNVLRKFSPALLITLDCGITNFKEIKLAKKFGFEVIIIDHHEILDKLPEAKIIVNPKQKGDRYSFKFLAAAGIVFKLSEILLTDKMIENLRKNFLELVMLATIADMMPKKDENLRFIEEGLKSIENSWRPAIQAFFEMDILNHFSSLNEKISKIISLLNVRDLENNLIISFKLLTSSSLEEVKSLIKRLVEKSLLRRENINRIIKEIEEKISDESIIFTGSSNWEFIFLSSVASNFCKKYQKPVFIFKILEKESYGTVRTPIGINSLILMKKCKRYLISYGGHPQASGFRIKNENLEKFKTCLFKIIN